MNQSPQLAKLYASPRVGWTAAVAGVWRLFVAVRQDSVSDRYGGAAPTLPLNAEQTWNTAAFHAQLMKGCPRIHRADGSIEKDGTVDGACKLGILSSLYLHDLLSSFRWVTHSRLYFDTGCSGWFGTESVGYLR